jgi:hypothetical protein
MSEQGFAFRNLIINGDMSIAQRSTSTSSYSGISYSTVDRFKTVFEYGTYTVSQESLSSGAAYNAGFRTAFKALVTSTASPGAAGEQVTFEQRIEGLMCQALKKGTSNAESLTLSFWVRSSKTGTNLQVNLRDNDNDRIIGATYDINTANTWEKKTFTFAGDTSGALDNDNGQSLILEWWLDGGSNYSGGSVPTSWQARDNADRNVTNFDLAGGADDWWITGVQLEAGTTASDFEFLPYDVNLMRCQRYYEKSYSYATAPGTNTYVGATRFNGSTDASSNMVVCIEYATQKRTSPTQTYYTPSGTSGSWNIVRSGSSGTATANNWNNNETKLNAYFTFGASHNFANGYVEGQWTADAEL